MKHPLFTNKRIFAVYSLVWLLLISIQTFAFFQLFAVSWTFALVDGLVFGVLFLIISVGTWYFIRFTNLEKKQTFPFLLEHTTAAFVLVSIWVFSGTLLLAEWFSASTDYVKLIWNAISWRYSSGLLIYVMMVVVYYLYINYAKNQEQIALENKLKQSLQNTEIDLLRSKLNPHFLFNSLNSLNALIQTDSQKASDMLVQLADFLRFSLESNKQDKINLETELHNLDRYIAIEQIRFGNRLEFAKEIESEALSQNLPAMILQPLMENALKHGLGNSLEPLKLILKAKMHDNFLIIQVENNFDSTALARKGAGHGIENVRKRLEGIYKNSAHFEISKSETVFQVQIKIPQQTYGNP